MIDRPLQRPRLSNLIKEQENSSPKDGNDSSPTSNDGAYSAKLYSDLNNRMSNSSQINNNNNIRTSSRRDNIDSSTGEITQF